MKKWLIVVGMLAIAGVVNAQQNTVYGQQAANSEQYSYADLSIFGYQALYACQYCYGTSAFGYEALRVSSGNYNTSMGYNSMYNATSGSYNTALGAYTLQNLGTGSQNVAIGYNSGSCATVNGSNNIWISHCGLAKDANVIRIGTQGTQKFTQIAGIWNTVVKSGQAVVVNAKGQIGVASTKLVSVANPATQDDVATLRRDLVATKNMVYELQRQVAALKAVRADK
jgi:hypothetical protein